MIIDSHVHAWADDDSEYPYATEIKPSRRASVEYLVQLMDQAGVNRAVIVQPRLYSWDNRYLMDCLRRFPGRFAAMGLVDPRSSDGPDRLGRLVREHGFGGLRLELRWEDNLDDFAREDRWPLWKRAEELGTCFGILGTSKDHSCVEPMVARFPGVKVVLDNLGGLPIDPEDQAVLIDSIVSLAKYSNVFVKVSNLQGKSNSGYPFNNTYDLVRRMYDTFGPDRLMWGTDFPSVIINCGYANAVELVRRHIPFFTDDDKERLFHKTAEKVWKFEALE